MTDNPESMLPVTPEMQAAWVEWEPPWGDLPHRPVQVLGAVRCAFYSGWNARSTTDKASQSEREAVPRETHNIISSHIPGGFICADCGMREPKLSLRECPAALTTPTPAVSTDKDARIAELEAENAKARRCATDRQYMVDALVQMLGPTGLQVWQRWQERGVQRVHAGWGPDAASMAGEERAQVLLEWETAPREPIDDVDAFLARRQVLKGTDDEPR